MRLPPSLGRKPKWCKPIITPLTLALLGLRRLKKLQVGRNRLAVLDMMGSFTSLTQVCGLQGGQTTPCGLEASVILHCPLHPPCSD